MRLREKGNEGMQQVEKDGVELGVGSRLPHCMQLDLFSKVT